MHSASATYVVGKIVGRYHAVIANQRHAFRAEGTRPGRLLTRARGKTHAGLGAGCSAIDQTRILGAHVAPSGTIHSLPSPLRWQERPPCSDVFAELPTNTFRGLVPMRRISRPS